MKTSQKQSGSAHAVIIVILVLSVLGLLGFVFWQNFINKKTVTQTTNQTQTTQTEGTNNTSVVAEATNAVFSTDELTFSYPKSGWKELKGLPDAVAEIDTNDYVHSQGMGLDSGASIAINHTTQQEVPQGMGTTDVQEIQIDGHNAYKYEMAYEGYRLQAFFTASDVTYVITMQTTTTPTDAEKQVFSLVLNTLHIK